MKRKALSTTNAFQGKPESPRTQDQGATDLVDLSPIVLQGGAGAWGGSVEPRTFFIIEGRERIEEENVRVSSSPLGRQNLLP